MTKLNLLLLLFVLQTLTESSLPAKKPSWSANWMASLPSTVVDNVPLVQLALPGSHDSFSYNLSLSNAPKVAISYARSQDWNITMQLKGGIRYFDLRIYVDHKGIFRFYHGLVKGGLAVLPALRLVGNFLKKHRGEFVILHFQTFDNIPFEKHRNLIRSTVELFGNLTVPKCKYHNRVDNLTLAQIRSAGEQVFLVSYNSLTEKVDDCTFWNSSDLMNPYFPTTNWRKMATTLSSELTNRTRQSRFFVYQAVLTPDTDYIVRHGLKGSLKKLALPATKFVATEWLPNIVGEHCENVGKINVVMCDFVDQFEFANQVALVNWNFTTCHHNTIVLTQVFV